MIADTIGFVLLLAALGFAWLVAIPFAFALYAMTAFTVFGALALAVIAVAAGCRGADKIRGV